MTTTEELQGLFDRQHTASRRQPAPDAATRRERLDRLAELISENEAELVATIDADFGTRSPSETRLLEILPVMNAIRHSKRHLRRWMKTQRRPVSLAFWPGRARIRVEPLGVVGIVSPWNYPLQLALAPLVDALAAGNRAMLKPSELAPRFADLLARLVSEYFDPEVVTVVTGGVELAQAFSALPFDHLFFTGSTNVGRLVMAAAAPNLTPVTLELGGKSPAVVADDYDLDKAARSVAFGKFANAGQTCVAPDYALVPKGQEKAFAEAVIAAARKGYKDPAGDKDYTAIITGQHRERLVRAVEDARAAGATVIEAGEAGANKITPTAVIGAPEDGVLMREEIFGPVLPVIGYDSLDGAISHIVGRDRPLALYVFSDDRNTIEKVLSGATSGGVTTNGTLLHVGLDTIPFGGVGPSGMGAYHGRDGFFRMSHMRGVYEVGFVNAAEKLGPPWGRLSRIATKFLTRR